MGASHWRGATSVSAGPRAGTPAAVNRSNKDISGAARACLAAGVFWPNAVEQTAHTPRAAANMILRVTGFMTIFSRAPPVRRADTTLHSPCRSAAIRPAVALTPPGWRSDDRRLPPAPPWAGRGDGRIHGPGGAENGDSEAVAVGNRFLQIGSKLPLPHTAEFALQLRPIGDGLLRERVNSAPASHAALRSEKPARPSPPPQSLPPGYRTARPDWPFPAIAAQTAASGGWPRAATAPRFGWEPPTAHRAPTNTCPTHRLSGSRTIPASVAA